MHEDVEGDRNTIVRDAVGRHGALEIALAAMMRRLVLVDDAEHLLRARRQGEVVPADVVAHDGQHRVGAVGVESVAG